MPPSVHLWPPFSLKSSQPVRSWGSEPTLTISTYSALLLTSIMRIVEPCGGSVSVGDDVGVGVSVGDGVGVDVG